MWRQRINGKFNKLSIDNMLLYLFRFDLTEVKRLVYEGFEVVTL